jgi:hypothetical protein
VIYRTIRCSNDLNPGPISKSGDSFVARDYRSRGTVRYTGMYFREVPAHSDADAAWETHDFKRAALE